MSEQNQAKRIAKILELEAQRSELEEAIKNMRASLAEEILDGPNPIGDFIVSKTYTTRFDDALAKKHLTVEEYDSISVKKADSKRAGALLSDEQLALCKKTFGSQIRINNRD